MQIELLSALIGAVVGAVAGALSSWLLQVWQFRKGEENRKLALASSIVLKLNSYVNHLNEINNYVHHDGDFKIIGHLPAEVKILKSIDSFRCHENITQEECLFLISFSKEFPSLDFNAVTDVAGNYEEILTLLRGLSGAISAVDGHITDSLARRRYRGTFS